MELDDMKAAWQTLDRRLDGQAALNLHLFKQGKLDRLRRGLRPLVWGQAVQIVVGTLIAIWAGSFWVDHHDVPHLLIAGLIVHAAGISMIALGALVLALIACIDYSTPVLTIQRHRCCGPPRNMHVPALVGPAPAACQAPRRQRGRGQHQQGTGLHGRDRPLRKGMRLS